MYSNVHCLGDEPRFSQCSKAEYDATTCYRGDVQHVVGMLCLDGNTIYNLK